MITENADLRRRQRVKLDETPKAKKRSYLKAKWAVARTRVQISVEIRAIVFNPLEKKRLIELLDRFLEQPAGEVGIYVGLEQAHPSMKELALIGMTFPLPSGMVARVAVLYSSL